MESIKDLLSGGGSEEQINYLLLNLSNSMLICKIAGKVLNEDEINEALNCVDPIIGMVDKISPDHNINDKHSQIKKDIKTSINTFKKE